MRTQPKNIIRKIPGGLVLRRATAKDADALASFNAGVHGDDEQDGMRVATWTRDLLTRPHPTLTPSDFTIVEEETSGRIVSSLNLIPQTWSFEGIEFGVGRPEMVGTSPEYRGRGLVRMQFDEIHKWCAERGLPVQAITGIPYFYRQFGYTMALELARGRFGYEPQVPELKDGEEEPYLVRPAQEADLDFIAEVYRHATQRHTITCVRTPEIFRYELAGQSEDSVNHYPMVIIEDRSGERVGYMLLTNFLGTRGITAHWYELRRGASWLEVTPSVVRYLWRLGQEYARREGKTCASFGFIGDTQHPVYQALGEDLPTGRRPYAYFIRVPDLPGFLEHIKPALERRLAESIAAGHTREIKLNFYRHGLRIHIEKGRIASIQSWKPVAKDEGDIAFPDPTFLQAVFGYRSYDELHQVYAECWCDHQEVHALINILFPKKLSDVFPLG